MSRLFKQIQQAQPKEPVFIPHWEPAIKQEQERKFNLIPCFCIISLFGGIILAYFYTDRDTQPTIAQKEIDITLPIQEKPDALSEEVQQPFLVDMNTETPFQERDIEAVLPEENATLAIDEPVSEEKLIFYPLQWNMTPVRDWIQEHWKHVFPKLQAFRESVNRFAYFDVTQPIPEKEISPLEKERLELIRRFLKRFKVDAVRIDGSFSRIMANGQAFYVNTVVSQFPKLKLTRITPQEMIFKDEYNQEYKKEISQND